MAGSKDKHWLTIGDIISIILDGLSLSSLLYFVIPYIHSWKGDFKFRYVMRQDMHKY